MREISTVAAYRDRWHITGEHIIGNQAVGATNRRASTSEHEPRQRAPWPSATTFLANKQAPPGSRR